ncbi:MAG: prepilin-type N-terminal cleavage/methylation domain-containing protein [Bdellovibrionaceae bacterium]|nr:prepilin-type N-terminal cleavage/methylation domain-containing protein [Pseudobdellovibrionaceae bacterium]
MKVFRKTLSIRENKGFSLIEVVVASGIMMIVLYAVSSMFISQNREMLAISQKMAVLDMEKFLILNTASGDVCTKYLTDNPSLFTFPTTSFPPTTPVRVNKLYLPSSSSDILIEENQPIHYAGNLSIDNISLVNITGSTGNYIASLVVAFNGSIRPLKSVKVNIKLASTVSGANTVLIGCPGLNTAGTIPLTNFIQFTNTSATETFTVPPGVAAILVEAWGGGGGGGGSAFSVINNYACGGGGGGGGGYGKVIIPVTPGQTFNVVVGSGGTAGLGAGTTPEIDASDGLSGGNSSFGGTILVATGGVRGTKCKMSPTSMTGFGGNGGTSSGSGVYTAGGGRGGFAEYNYTSFTAAVGGSGGSAGGGGGGGGGALSPGSIPGGGGGGGSRYSDVTGAYSGASGARGQVNVWW